MKNRNFRTLKSLGQRQAGYTLVELAISVSIISLLIVSSIAGVQGLLLSNKVNRTLTQTTVATANITKLITATNDTTLSTDNLIKLGAWDKSAVRSVTTSSGTPPVSKTAITAENPFGGIIQVAANKDLVGTYAIGSGFWYRLSNVPESHCASLATSLYTTSPGIYINKEAASGAIAVGTTNGDGVAYRKPGFDDSLSNLATACEKGAGTNGLVELALFIPT
jgi:prepilin-type N-terminal cleavage/methylation domain-containing protein